MEFRDLGDSRLAVSVVGLGCNNFGRAGRATAGIEGTGAVLDAAIEAGVTFLDTADMYGAPPTTSERLMGEALAGRRDQVVIATKFGHTGFPVPGTQDWGPKGGRTYIRRACEASLQRLRTDRIDLYQQHTPDPEVPVEETLGALHELADEGKIRAFGHSNYSPTQAVEADEAAAALGLGRFVSAQNEYSLLARGAEHELLPVLAELRVGFLPFFPLYNGLLTGKYTRAGAPSDGRITQDKPQLLDGVDWDQLERYQAICDEVGASMGQVTLAWLLTRPVISSVIAGATTPEQVRQNASAADLALPPEAVERIDALFATR